MKNRFLLFFYLVSIFALPNDALFNWIGGLCGIAFWRQLIWLVGVFSLFIFISKRNNNYIYINKICGKFNIIYILILFLCVFTILVYGFSTIRVLNSFIDYTYGIIFVIFPALSFGCGWTRKQFNYFFIAIGVFLSAGFLVDFALDGAITMLFHVTQDGSIMEFDSGRFQFFATAVTTLSVFYCLCLLCCFVEIKQSKGILKVLLLLITLFFIFGCIFSGSRQTLAALIIEEAAGLFFVFRRSRASIVTIIFSALIAILLMPQARNILSENSGFESRYAVEDIKNDERSVLWVHGFEDTFSSITRLTIGDGVGFVHGQKASLGEKVGLHYENTYFARISEIGLVLGLLTLLLPVFYIIRNRKNNEFYVLYLGATVAYLFISFVSPNGGAMQTQMPLYILLALSFEDNKRKKAILDY